MAKKVAKKGDKVSTTEASGETKPNDGLATPKKKVDIYRKALKRTLDTGMENIDDDPVLKELRSTLNISPEFHLKLKSQIKAEISSQEKLQKESKLKITKIERQINELKKKGIDTKIIEDLLDRAREAKKESSYAEFNVYINESSKIANNIQRKNKIIHQMDDIKKTIVKAEKMGANVKHVKTLIKKAELATEKGNFTEASKLATAARKESTALRKFGTAKKQIQKFNQALNQVKKKIDVEECEKLISQAQKALKKNDYKLVTSTIIKAKKLLISLVRTETALEKVEKSYAMLEEARKAGMNLKKIEPMVEQLEKFLQEKEYNKLSQQTTQIRAALEDERKFKNANDIIDEAQHEIEGARAVGSSVKTANRLLSQAKTALKKKKYSNVYKNARSAIKIAKEARVTTERRKVKSAISSAQYLINDVKDFGVDVSAAEELLGKAFLAMDEKKTKDAIEIAEEAEQLAKKIFDQKKNEYLKKGIKESLLNTKFIINELGDFELDTSEIETLFKEASEIFESGDYEAAEEKVKEVEKLSRESLDSARHKQRVEKAKVELESCRKSLDEAREMDIEIFEIESLFTNAEKLFEEENYDEAMEKTKEFQQNLATLKDEISKTRAQTLITSTLTLINDAKNLGADLSEAEEIMDEVKVNFKAENFARAEELVKSCQQVAKNAWSDFRSDRANKALVKSKEVIISAQNAGINVKESEELIESAIKKMEAEDYELAEELFNKAQVIAQRLWDDKKIIEASESFKVLQKRYEIVVDSGFDLTEFETLLNAIEKGLHNRELEDLDVKIERAQEISEKIVKEYKEKIVTEKIQKSNDLILTTKEIGLNTDELENKLAEAKQAIQNNNFETAEERIWEIEVETNNLFSQRRKEISTEIISETRKSIAESREIGADVTEAEKLLSEAEELLGNEEFDITKVQNLLEKAKIEAKQSWVQKKAELTAEAVSSAKSMIEETKEMGADVSEAENLINEAEEMFKEEDFDQIDDYLGKVKDMVQSTQIQRKSELANEAVTSTKALLAKTRDMGGDVSEAEQLLGQAEGMFQDDDYDSVEKFIKRAEEALKSSQMVVKREETSKTISSTKAKIVEGKEKGADVSEAEDLLKEAENILLSEQDVTAVEQLIQQSQTSLASSWDQYRSQKLIDDISKMSGKIEKFRGMGFNVAKAEEILHKAEVEYKKENMDKVEEFLGSATDIVEKDYEVQYNKKITLLIEEVQTLLRTAKDLDLDVSTVQSRLKEATIEFEKKNYKEAEIMANKAKEIVTELIESFDKEETEKILNRVAGLIEDANAFKIDVSPAERLFRQAKALFKANEFKSCQENAIKSENILNSLAKTYIQNIHPHITVEVKEQTLDVNKWNNLRLIITNEGKIKALDVELGLKGDFQIKGKRKIDYIDTDESVQLELGFNSEKVGEVPIKVLMRCQRPFDGNEYKFTDDVVVTTKEIGKFTIEDIFLIYIDGCLILHKTKEYREIVDEDIFSGMLVAVQNFVTDSFHKSATDGLRRLDFGESKILLENGPKFFIALVMEGEEPGLLPLFMVETINEIQDQFGETLDDWDGNLEKLKGIEDFVDKLLNLEIVPGSDDLTLGTGQDSTVMSVRSMMSDVQELGVDTDEIESELKKAEEMVEESDYSTVMQHIENAKKIVRKKRQDFYYDDVKSAISTVKEEITSAKAEGAEISEVEEMFDEMKEMVKSEAFPQVLEKTEIAKKIIQTSRKQTQTKNALQKLDGNLKVATDWGLNVPNSDMEKVEIETALDGQEFDKAMEKIEKLNNTLRQTITKISLDKIDTVTNVNKNLEEMKGFDMDTSDIKKVVNTAFMSIQTLDLTQAKELLDQANTKLTTERENYFQDQANESIKSVKNSIAELQGMKVDTLEAIRLLAAAENNLREQDFKGALNVASNLQQQLTQTTHKHKSQPILDKIISLEANIGKANVRGFEPEQIQPIQDLVNQAKDLLEQKNYDKANVFATDAEMLAEKTFTFLIDEREQIKEQIDSTLSMISTTKEIGGDASNAERVVGRMKELLDTGDIDATKRYMESIKDTLDKLQIPYKTAEMEKQLRLLEKYINESKEKGIDTSEAEHLMENARSILDTEDFESVEEYIIKANESLAGANETHRAIVISETIQSTLKLINEVKTLGAEIHDSEELLNQAGDMLRNMDLNSAEDLVTNAMETAQKVKTEFLSKEANEQIAKAEQAIEEATSTGLKTSDAERLVKQAKDFLETEELENSKQYALNAQQIIIDVTEHARGKDAREILGYVKQMHKEIKALGANVVSSDSHIMQAQSSFENKDYEMTIHYAKEAKEVLKQIKAPYSLKLAKGALNNADKAIMEAQKYGAEVTDAQKLYNEAHKAFIKKKYDLAEEQAKKAQKIAHTAKQQYYDNYISNQIKTIKDNIGNLKNQGYDVTTPEDMLSKVNAMYLDKDFSGIGEGIKDIRNLLVKLEEKKYVERAKDAINYSKAMINYIKNNILDIGKFIKQPEKILKNAILSFKKKDYIRAERYAIETQRAVENIKHSKLEQFLFVFKQLQAEELLSVAKNLVSSIKKLGVDMTDVEELIKQAEEAFKSDETYDQAKEFLTDAKIQAHEKENQFQEKNASSAISTAESLILTLKQKGVDVATADRFLSQAKTALDIREFKKSILFAGKAKFTAKKLMGNIPVAAAATQE
jgi:hypothetical protein